MISHVISAWSATWSVHDHPRDDCMIRNVISALSATRSVYDQPRDQCMISHVITACKVTWSVYYQLNDHCIISYVITVWLATWSVLDIHVINAWSSWSQLHKETLLNSLPWCSVLSFTISELGIHHPARSLMPASPPDSPATHHPPSRTIQESGHPSDFSSSHPLQSANISSQVCHSFHPSPTQYHLRPRFCGNLPNDLHDPDQPTPVHSTTSKFKSGQVSHLCKPFCTSYWLWDQVELCS